MIYETQTVSGSASLAEYYLQNGKGTHAYRYFGVHRLKDREGWCYVFRVAAPGADRVSLVGEWDGWEPVAMERLGKSGVWEIVTCAEICPEGLRYKYLVQTKESLHYKADPYARKSESTGEGASYIYTESHYVWQDLAYLSERAQSKSEHERYAYPMNIYEVELSGWLGDRGETRESGTGYRVIADLLAQYAADMGYTHVLVHSIGRQNAGKDGIFTYFAPDAMLGEPDDFAYFVDRMHKQHIGVLASLECCTLGTHAGGLCHFDGTRMYTERAEGRVCFDLTDPYATSLLYSSAMFWLREYHMDGLMIDAEDMPRKHSTGIFLREMAKIVRRGAEDALLMLRASGYRGLSATSAFGGFGYDMILDARAERSLLDCFGTSPKLCVAREAWRECASYLYEEDGILALSSKLVLQRGATILNLMDGDEVQKQASMRLALLYMTCLPGKKLSFMGNEIGQMRPWEQSDGMEWFLQEFERHKALQEYVKSLGMLYLQTPALWECDYSKEGMCALQFEDAPKGVIGFKRFDRFGREICALINFGEQRTEQMRVSVGGRYPYYEQIFCTAPQNVPVRYQTDGQGIVSLSLEGRCGILLAPLEPSQGFWLENV